MNKKEQMLMNIEKHGANLNAIFETGIENTTLCRKLFRLERKANRATTCLCNTNTLHLMELNRFTGYDVEQATEEKQEKFFEDILNEVDKILSFRSKGVEVFINYDPRGYAFKIKNAKGMQICTDWGGYGIIAPDFSA
jgi:hypothetical protein